MTRPALRAPSQKRHIRRPAAPATPQQLYQCSFAHSQGEGKKFFPVKFTIGHDAYTHFQKLNEQERIFYLVETARQRHLLTSRPAKVIDLLIVPLA